MDSYTENLKKGVVLVFVANLINLVISLANGFILPKYLSVETYASIKTYQLYANYIGVLALGYSDGLYLKYGGKNIKEIPNDDINICRTNTLLFQGVMSVIFLIIGFAINDKVLFITALTVIPVNIASNFKNILQATGEFKVYSRIVNYTSVLTFIGTMVLLFIVRTDVDLTYVSLMAAVTYIVWFLLERNLRRTYSFVISFKISIQNLIENIKSGVVLMLGNFSSILLTSIDRWFVKFLLSTTNFAYYSFVVSAENLVAVFINPVVTTMYNYICVTSDYNAIRKIKRMCMIFALYLVSGAYVVKFILEIYLTKYLASQYVLFILFATEILFIVIKGIYVNIYKAQKRQDIYLKQLVVVIIISVILNTVFYLLFKSNEGIAVATLLSVVLWYVICCFSVKEVRPDWKEILVLLVCIPAYIAIGILLPSVIGFFAYVALVFVMCMLFMRQDFIKLVKMLMSMVGKKLKKRKN